MSDDSTIVFQRCPHNKENPYAQISRSLIRDESISPECRWMLIYFLSMRDDFKINCKQLWAHVKQFMGRDKVYRIIEEACKAGYMKKEDRYVGNLKRGVTYYVSEEPNEEFKKSFRRPDFQDTEIRDTENQEALSSNNNISLSKKNIKKEREKKKEEEGAAPPVPPTHPSDFFLHGRVKMEKHLHEQLVQDFGLAKVNQYIQKLEEFADINPKRFKGYANHATVLRKWMREDNEKKPQAQAKGDKHNFGTVGRTQEQEDEAMRQWRERNEQRKLAQTQTNQGLGNAVARGL